MNPSLQTIVDQVTRRVVPTSREREQMDRLSKQLRDEVDAILAKARIEADVSVQGSVARDTWVRREADLDIFARFPPEIDRKYWTEKVLPVVRKGLQRYPIIERYAEHPYLEFHVNSIRVNVVPCYNVKKGEWKSATDRTPYHTEYMKKHLTPELRVEARILKKFLKGIRVYGAEIRVGGFSGMLAETLILNSQSFVATLERASKWTNGTVIDIEHSRQKGDELRRKFETVLVVVDPVDAERNLAAAVREDRFWSFVAAGREFLKRPGVRYFYPKEVKLPTKSQLTKRLGQHGHDVVVVEFSHTSLVADILWGQLLRLEKALAGLMKRYEFRVLRSSVWSDDNQSSCIFFEVDRAVLPRVQLHMGPPVWKEEDSNSFLAKHVQATNTTIGPWIDENRWYVEKTREAYTVSRLLRKAAKAPGFGLVIPSLLKDGFHRTVKVLVNEEAMSIYRVQGFGSAFWEFLDGRPGWLKSAKP